jgi:hypothetical protein
MKVAECMNQKFVPPLRRKSAPVMLGGANELVPNGAMSHTEPKRSEVGTSLQTMRTRRSTEDLLFRSTGTSRPLQYERH